jgi:hypothetical protein
VPCGLIYASPLIILIVGIIYFTTIRKHGIMQICTLLACYVASSGNPLQMFQDSVSAASLDFLTLEDGTNVLS